MKYSENDAKVFIYLSRYIKPIFTYKQMNMLRVNMVMSD